MRKFILIAGFVLVSVAAQAGDRSFSLGGGEATTASRPGEAPERSKIAEVPSGGSPEIFERPAVVEPKPETTKAETHRRR